MPNSIHNIKKDKNLLARNTLWNFIGQGVPLLIALFSVPPLIKIMGTARFGILTLAWALMGYASLFDFGVGRALTHLLAQKLTQEKREDASHLVWTSLLFLLVLGVIIATLIALISRWIVYSVFHIPDALQRETLLSFYLLAATIPIVIITAGLRGILHAHHRFDLANAIQMPLGITNFLGPLIIVPFSNSLLPIFGVLVAARFVFFFIYVKLCHNVMPALKQKFFLKLSDLKDLLKVGSWMTVSNIVGPVMVYMDRFILGAMVPIATVAYYTTPYEVITRLWIVPSSFGRTLFPAFSSTYRDDKQHAVFLFLRGIKYIFLILFPIILVVLTFAREGLELWIGAEFASQSFVVLQWLAIGVFINSLVQINFNLIQGAGRPDLTAKLHLFELPIYLISLWFLIRFWGIEGAAIAWVGRVTLDACILFVITRRLIPIPSGNISQLLFALMAAFILFAQTFVLQGIGNKSFFLLIVLAIFLFSTWLWFFNDKERGRVRRFLLRR